MFGRKHAVLSFEWEGRALSAYRQVVLEAIDKHHSRLRVPFPVAGLQALLNHAYEDTITCEQAIPSFAVQPALKPLPGVKNIIAVASGKGGVGKSTVAVNVALALQADGARVGLLDADIYGPSQPMMLGGQEKPTSNDGKTMNPVMKHGLQTMSIGYLLEGDAQPVIWRGPMVSTALKQLLNDTQWQDLDYLLIDLPPGTGDIQLTMVQKIPLSGAIVVTTPQPIAVIDAKKALRMFEKVHVPVLGVVENMSYHLCTQCGHRDLVFGAGGGKEMTETFKVPLLGHIPLDAMIREQADKGVPVVMSHPQSALAGGYLSIARMLAAELAMRPKTYAHAFNVVVEHTPKEP